LIALLAWLPWFRRWFGGRWRRRDRLEVYINVPPMSATWLEEHNQP
jgi:hypothetical protein